MFVKKLMVKVVNGGKNPGIAKVIEVMGYEKDEDTGGIKGTPKNPAGQFIGRFFIQAEKMITRDSAYANGEGELKAEGWKGTFKAIAANGDSYESNTAYFPSIVHEAIKHAMQKDPATGEIPDSATAVFDIFAVVQTRDMANPKYEYRAEPVLAPEVKHDPFAHLVPTLPPLPTLVQLAAPTADTSNSGAAAANTGEPVAAKKGGKK